VNTPDDINALFDDITYEKSGSIIRMVNRFAGDEAFIGGLKKYFDDNKYGSVNHDQLFSYWEQAISESADAEMPPDGGFAEAMNSWVLQMGYPTVTMTRSKEDASKVIVTQERFLLDPNADPSQPTSMFQYRWTIPLWWRTVYDSPTLTWIPRNQDVEIPVTLVGGDDYFIGNYEAYGFYRVNYERENWMNIIKALDENYEAIEVKTRAQLIDDALNLARAGKLSYDIALSTTKFLRNDLSYVPWESALDALAYFDLVLGRSKALGVYTEYLIYLVKPLYDK
jgi:aminopeptidase N